MENVFNRIYQFFEKKPWLFYTFFFSILALMIFGASRVKFIEDISGILPKDKKVEKLNEVFQQSRFMDKMVFNISQKDSQVVDPDRLVAYADALESALTKNVAPYIRKIELKVDDEMAINMFGSIQEHLPVYLTNEDYTSIDSLITVNRLDSSLAQHLKTLTSPASIALKSMISKDPVGISFLGLRKLQQLQYDEQFELYDGYIMTKDRKHLMVFLTPIYPPSNTGKNQKLLEGIDRTLDDLDKTDFKTIDASYFGATAVSVGNALQLRKDTLLTQGITVLFIVIFLGIYFRRKRAPFLIMLPVLMGALFALALIGIIKGSMSVIALATGSIVLGIAVNYSLHVYHHYRHTGEVKVLFNDLATPLTIGSLTTIGGFLCLLFVKSDMLKDLGLFAALSLIGASLSALIFLPHFIVRGKQIKKATTYSSSWIDWLAALKPETNKYLVYGIFLLTILFAFWSTRVKFESDMQSMNFMSNDLKLAEKKLNEVNKFSLRSVYLVTEGSNLDDALKNNERLDRTVSALKAQGIIEKSSGVNSLIISDSLQRERIEQWNKYWTADKKSLVLDRLASIGLKYSYRNTAFFPFRELINKEYKPVNHQEMSEISSGILSDYITEKPGKASVVTLVKVNPNNKEKVYDALKNNEKVTVLDKQYLAGRFAELVREDFSSIAWMTSILVFLVLLAMYGRIELALMSFIPMLFSWIWILGIMGLTGLKFNIINIIISALIFGLGDDYSLFIMDGLLQEYKTGKKNLTTFKSAILLSAVTTLAGLGVLIFAQHPALKSIALMSMIGIICVVIMSQILIPFFFNLLISNRVKKGLFPWTLSKFIKSSFAFSYFLHWSIFFTVVGRIFVRLRVKERGKLLYHQMISGVAWSLMYIMGNVKKKIENPENETLKKPAIIICNHQSSLDIVPLAMLSPRILMFTNNRKWNAPFFGPVIRMADYFPAEQVEQHLDQIADRMRQGYSFVIFPEGTRSMDGSINRFHKGAFYLAEKLQADILPIMIHGTAYTLTKRDTLLKDGQVTVRYLPRIAYDDLRFGNGYVERSKKIKNYFKEEFESLKQRVEDSRYFREQLFYNYLYKGPVLEWYMRIKVGLEKNYRQFDELLPRKGRILDAGCGYGFMAYMLAFTAPDRDITGVDYDAEKIATANNCFSKTERIRFKYANIREFVFEQYEAIIFADMLHYLPEDAQHEVISKAIESITPGGMLIIREGNKEDAERHGKTKMTEFFSTKLFKFNKTEDAGLSFLSGTMIRKIAVDHQMKLQEYRDSELTSNTIYLLKKNLEDYGEI